MDSNESKMRCIKDCTPCCHPELDSGSCRYREEALNKSVFRAPLRSGFTLVELLIVVLIIGVLSAVALPQYKKAVIKSKVATILPMMDALVKAEEVYYLANDTYTTDLSPLDLQPLAGCELTEETATTYKCKNGFLIEWSSYGGVLASYCPGDTDNFTSCKSARILQLGRGGVHLKVNSGVWIRPGIYRCVIQNSSQLGEGVCKSLGKEVDENGKKRWEFY